MFFVSSNFHLTRIKFFWLAGLKLNTVCVNVSFYGGKMYLKNSHLHYHEAKLSKVESERMEFPSNSSDLTFSLNPINDCAVVS